MGESAQTWERLTADQMDEQRVQNEAYQYLCRLEEAKRWMEACLQEALPAPTELEEALRNGVWLAKLGHCFAPDTVPLRKIYDPEQRRYAAQGLQFRHTDNINHWRNAMLEAGLPAIFHPETTDVYDKKNMPRAIYCIHALSLYLFRMGLAPQIHDLCGKVQFTDEELLHVKVELEELGVQMPAFSKIGGILASELPVDQAAVHAAVIAINEAVSRGDARLTAQALSNPHAALCDLQGALMGVYHEVLSQARTHKAERASTQSCSSEKEIYEENLSQREIQEEVHRANVHCAAEQVDEALDSRQEVDLLAALLLPALRLRNLRAENISFYMETLRAAREDGALGVCIEPLDAEQLQLGVDTANQEVEQSRSMHEAVLRINAALRGTDATCTLRCLMDPDAQLPQVQPRAAALYHQQLALLAKQHTQGALQQEQLFVAVEMLSAVALINQTLKQRDLQAFCSALTCLSAGLSAVQEHMLHRYFSALSDIQHAAGSDMLTWNQLQEVITSINMEQEQEEQHLLSIGLINQAASSGNPNETLAALMLPHCGVEEVQPATARRYHELLAGARRRKGGNLYLDEIQEVVMTANQQTQMALKRALAVAAVNQAVKEGSAVQTLRVLQLPEVALQSLRSECAAAVQTELRALRSAKAERGDNRSPWVRTQTEDGTSYYLHLSRLEGTWDRPPAFTHNSLFLTYHDIQEVVSSIAASSNRARQWTEKRDLLVLLQARSRGFLLRKTLSARLQYLGSQESAALQIQSWVRMVLVRRRFRARLDFFTHNVGAVIKIQAWFRAYRAREEYRKLVCSAVPPLAVLRKFVYLLDLGDADIHQEAELLRLRQEVVRLIRSNRKLEADLNVMDLKIGLLVRNRVTLQEVVSHCKKLTRKNKEQLSDLMVLERSTGLKALNRKCRERLENYQHLFYLLQTQPLYLAQLIVLMPHSKSTCFLETVLFSLFNYGSECRDAFLLLQLFTAALQHHIRLQVERPQEVATGSALVMKLLVTFYRQAGQNALHGILGNAVQEVLQDPSLSLRTDPVEVYRSWINQTETQTGNQSVLPYDVTAEQALSHPEVQRRLDVSIVNLKHLTERVLDAITSNLHQLPYGLRYAAKVLRDTLRAKFPETSEEELYKIVGNLVYYRYMNPAVVAPDGFDVLHLSAGSALLPGQRRILGSIARMLQYAAANKHFHGNGPHLHILNEFIDKTHQRFRKFLHSVCDVPEPEQRFSVDQYSELILINKPLIHISVSELLNTHKLLLDHQDQLCSGPSDPLRLLLRDLGAVPSLQDLLGEAAADSGSDCTKMEVSLTLTSKFDVFDDSREQQDARGILLSTKLLVVDVLRSQPGDSLRQILQTSTSRDQELRHGVLVQSRARQDARTAQRMRRNPSLVADGNMSLDDKKRKILRSLRRLEALGVLHPPDPEVQVLHLIAKDICQRSVHRQQRAAELQRLRQTLSGLQEKSSAQRHQVDYYSHYITSCLDNLTTRQASSQKAVDGRRKPVTYSATRLLEKGVLLEIQELPATQFKNVVFEIEPGQETGSFRIKTRFLGVDMEEFTLKYQDLLQLQYDGVAVMKMFDNAKVNVNLLIFLLNRKFYRK